MVEVRYAHEIGWDTVPAELTAKSEHLKMIIFMRAILNGDYHDDVAKFLFLIRDLGVVIRARHRHFYGHPHHPLIAFSPSCIFITVCEKFAPR